MSVRRRVLPGLLFAALSILPASAQSTGNRQQSPDAHNNRPHPVRLQLELSRPQLAAPLVSECTIAIPVPYIYTGLAPLIFSLGQGPPGMTIDDVSGTLLWTPPKSAEGTSPAVRVEVTDATASAALTFTLPVATFSPLPTTVSASALKITDPGNLNDVTFTYPSDATTSAAVSAAGRLEAAAAPALPPGFTRISDFFRLTPSKARNEPIIVSFPAKIIPSGTRPERLRLMVYSQAHTEAAERAWIAVWSGLDVKPDHSVTVTLGFVGELSCIAVAAAGTKSSDSEESEEQQIVTAADATCEPFRLSSGEIDSSRQVCTVTGEMGVKVVIKDVDRNQWQPKATAAEIASWLAAGRKGADDVGLIGASEFEVVIEPITGTASGFVSRLEAFKVLHLNESARPKTSLQGSAVHEYFHYAQARTRLSSLDNLLWESDQGAWWVIEGTARWFEDVVFDDLDTYRPKEVEPLPRVLSPGLNAWPNKEAPRTRPYSRFAFFKMVSSRCPDLDIADAVNASVGFDPTGIDQFAKSLEKWHCKFADQVAGVQPASLEAAMLDYTYATVGQNAMGWLEDDEKNYDFENTYDLIFPETTCTAAGSCPTWAQRIYFVPRAATVPLRVEAANVPDGREAVLQIRSGTRPLKAWIGSDEGGGIEGGKWVTVNGTYSQVYKTAGRAPRLLVILINPNTAENTSAEIRAMLRSTGPQEGTTTFSQSWTYTPQDVVTERYVKNNVLWNASATAWVTLPMTAVVTGQIRGSQLYLKACAPNTDAFTMVMKATPQASTLGLTGRIGHPDVANADLEWKYSNPRLRIAYDDPNATITGNSAMFNVPVVKNASFGRAYGVCVAYDLEQWTVYPDGRRVPFGGLQLTCQTPILLDLRVGNPPPCD